MIRSISRLPFPVIILMTLSTCDGLVDPKDEDSTAPIVSIVLPGEEADVSGIIVIEAVVTDDSEINRVEFFVDELQIGTVFDAPYRLVWNSENIDPGDYSISCIAYDEHENSGRSQDRMVTVRPLYTSLELLGDYMMENGMDLVDVLSNWIISASSIEPQLEDYFIVDIRAQDAYDAGHIPGAINSSFAEAMHAVEAQNTTNRPVVVVCYTGQSAGMVVMALRLSGYTDARVLKWGMSGWHSDFDSWTGNVGDEGVGHANWSTNTAPAWPAYDLPVIDTDLTEAAAILAERVEVLLSGGFRGVNAVSVLAGPENYQILNYWGIDDYDAYGHIAGAYQVTPGSLNYEDGSLQTLDPEATVVIYCWTGQTSAMATAWLTVMGYDVRSLKFGVNSMIYSELTSHKWIQSMDYEYVTGP